MGTSVCKTWQGKGRTQRRSPPGRSPSARPSAANPRSSPARRRRGPGTPAPARGTSARPSRANPECRRRADRATRGASRRPGRGAAGRAPKGWPGSPSAPDRAFPGWRRPERALLTLPVGQFPWFLRRAPLPVGAKSSLVHRDFCIGSGLNVGQLTESTRFRMTVLLKDLLLRQRFAAMNGGRHFE